MRLLLLGGRAPSPRAALDVRAHCPGVPAAGGGTHPAGLRPVLCRSANRTRALWGAERDVTAGGAATSAPAGPRGGPLGWAGPDLRGPDPKAALSADPSCSFPLPGAEASSSSDPARSSACVTTGGRRASCTRRPPPARAPPGTPGWGDAPSRLPHARTPPGTPGWGDAPGRLVRQARGGSGQGLGGRARSTEGHGGTGWGQGEGRPGAGPPTQLGTPCPTRSATDGHCGQCCCRAPGHVSSAATREALGGHTTYNPDSSDSNVHLRSSASAEASRSGQRLPSVHL